MPQVRCAGKSVMVDATTTADAVLDGILQKLGKSDKKADLRLVYKGLPLTPGESFLSQMKAELDVYDCEISPKPKELAPKEEVLNPLHVLLAGFIAKPPLNTFLFISTGSYLATDKGLTDACAQQLPDDVVKYCTDHKLELLVFLVDPNFGKNEPQHQIYHYPSDQTGWVWQKQVSSDETRAAAFRRNESVTARPSR